MKRVGCAVFLLLVAAGCSTHVPAPNAGATFVVVRHGEKASDDPRDPSLNAAGIVRAQVLAGLLRGEPLHAAYATRYRRTQMTATPAARAAGIAVTTYDADMPATEFAQQLQNAHPDGTVLVVGHSNTVPRIAAALCNCTVPAMGDDTFNLMHRIRVAPGTAPVLQSVRY